MKKIYLLFPLVLVAALAARRAPAYPEVGFQQTMLDDETGQPFTATWDGEHFLDEAGRAQYACGNVVYGGSGHSCFMQPPPGLYCASDLAHTSSTWACNHQLDYWTEPFAGEVTVPDIRAEDIPDWVPVVEH